MRFRDSSGEGSVEAQNVKEDVVILETQPMQVGGSFVETQIVLS